MKTDAKKKGKTKEVESKFCLPRAVCRQKMKSKQNISPSGKTLSEGVPRDAEVSEGRSSSSTLDTITSGRTPSSKIFVAKKGCSLPEGLGSLGSRALQIQAKVHSLSNEDFDTRMDSGTDIMLMLEEFYNSLSDLPCLKEGLRIKLYHLMGNTKVLGYVRMMLFAVANDSTIVSFELEAYVVRGMRVLLLIGEDFQTTYELGLECYASGHSKVKVRRDSSLTIVASSALSVELGFEICQAYTT